MTRSSYSHLLGGGLAGLVSNANFRLVIRISISNPRSSRTSCGPVNAVELDHLGGYGSASAIRHDQATERQNHRRAPAKASEIIDRLNGAVPAGTLVRAFVHHGGAEPSVRTASSLD
jgi:hypothetical protein